MRLLKFPKNCYIGKNNYIEIGVKLFENIHIGDNNKIYDGTVIYPNTKIGDNNVILNNNIIGEHPIEAGYEFKKKIFNGIEIGNNNYFHVDNLIFNGYHRKTLIGNNNKILAESHIGHDAHIKDNIVLYPRVIVGGQSTLLDNSTIGMQSSIQQNSVLGHFSMIGMGNIASHNVFPFYIYFNQKYLRFNKMKIPENLSIENYKNDIENLIKDLKENNCEKNVINKYTLPENIKVHIIEFLDCLTIKKL